MSESGAHNRRENEDKRPRKVWWILCINLTGLRDVQVIHYFWVCLWRCLWKGLAFELETLKTLSNLITLEQKGTWRVNLLSLHLGRASSPALRHSCVSGLGTQTGTCIIGYPSSQAFKVAQESHHQLSWASSLQMADLGLLSLQCHMGQSLTINLSLYIYIYPIGSVPLENPD